MYVCMYQCKCVVTDAHMCEVHGAVNLLSQHRCCQRRDAHFQATTQKYRSVCMYVCMNVLPKY